MDRAEPWRVDSSGALHDYPLAIGTGPAQRHGAPGVSLAPLTLYDREQHEYDDYDEEQHVHSYDDAQRRHDHDSAYRYDELDLEELFDRASHSDDLQHGYNDGRDSVYAYNPAYDNGEWDAPAPRTVLPVDAETLPAGEQLEDVAESRACAAALGLRLERIHTRMQENLELSTGYALFLSIVAE
ncbi:uncharacterized protein CcaverHIS019_0500060 [Cutaneotrichosporon cavernicola]|uniref:Uncharacterized protein n=1 Tax=Cutaneotrichosporon cavernicola TaxID=279322 RepID=A0AA48L5M3_9TREE|nr:uncharacterized protein CcaverHIS019_0500060 [Cutaneotrichosporon cavernicola]BEI92378.1 hypothetical protein CcaverHIS019_0500060 [Cutaneotrichosporon cavernicola]BEJ07921.1 hypothetical protein CcaverHIS641_0500060 [Cutaneotrichosporon cavernicola]